MLCKVVEDNKAKCFQYFPLEQGSYKNYGCMFVNNKRVETNDDKCTIYTLEILPDGCSNSNIVKLIHMDQWPDRGVPEKPMPILRLIKAIPAGLCVSYRPLWIVSTLVFSDSSLFSWDRENWDCNHDRYSDPSIIQRT